MKELGSNLSPEVQGDIKRRFVHRLTIENGYPKFNPCRAKVKPITDKTWLENTYFQVKKDGTLDDRYNRCECFYKFERAYLII